ncbi:MAG TPA: hypothetical protein VLA13_08735 [Massilibacterium sp.]|nr:hypothetical protein [Massilibacterium sp.]
MNKRDRDLRTGLKIREKTDAILNNYFRTIKSAQRVESIHPYTNLFMSIKEKTDNCEVKNLIYSAGFQKAMGLYRIYTFAGNKLNMIPLIYLYKKDDNSMPLYLKLPKEYKYRPDEYMYLMNCMNFHILIINEDLTKFSRLIPFSVIRKAWSWKVQTSSGNRNRLDFHVKRQHMKLKQLGISSGFFDIPLHKDFKQASQRRECHI